MNCTGPDCTKETSLFLCTTCIVELDQLLQDVPFLTSVLDGPIARTSVTSSPGAGGGGGKAGSKPAVNLDALLLKAWLCQLPRGAHHQAMENEDAGQVLFMARLWVEQARDLVWGPEDRRVYGECEEPIDGGPDPTLCDGQLTAHPDDLTVKCPACAEVHMVSDIMDRLRARARGGPMAPRAVREYLRVKARAFIIKKDFENWAARGLMPYALSRVNTAGKDRRIYYPGDVLSVHQAMQDRRRHSA